MTKRILSVFLIAVMLIGILPAEAFAANGTNLGWEYADIEENRSSSGVLTGYDLADPSASNYSGDKSDYGAYVTVQYVNGTSVTTMTQGQDGRLDDIMSSTSTGYIDITCDYGYYISWIVLCCGNNGRSTDEPFSCRTVGTEDAYGLATADSIPTHVRLNISDLYANANHDSNDDSYYLMIQLDPIPTPVYVVYDAGVAGSTAITADPVNTSVSITDSGFRGWEHTETKNPAMEYGQGESAYSVHTTLDITEAAESQAQAVGNGYSFAGWRAEYYRYYDPSTNTFSNLLETGSGYDQPGDPITLYTYVKMTAIWQPMEAITVSKVWNDNNDQDGLRPEYVTVYLVADGAAEVDSAVLSEANGWTHTWIVPSLSVTGSDIVYSVTESAPAGYTPTVTGDEINGFVITNTHISEKIDITVNKLWSDADNQDGLRPSTVTVHLTVNGEHYGTPLVLSQSNNWSGSWTNLPKYQSGTEISYVVVEETVSGYTPTYDRNGYHVNITNTHNSELTSMTVQKFWNDGANQDGIRPSSVTVQLLADGAPYGAPITLNADNHWYHTYTNLPKYNKGVLVQYTAEEVSVPSGYTVSYNFNVEADTYEVTNTHIPETVEVSVEKVWSDAENQDGIRPTSVTVALYKDGVATGMNAVLNAANSWTYTFSGIAKNSAGTPAVYTVREVSVPAGYTVGYSKTVDANGNTLCTITNSHIPELTDLTVSKIWQDGNDQDGKRPKTISVSLLADGSVVQTASLDAGGNWTHTFQGMPVYMNGRKITYSVTEEVPEGYTASVDGLVITNSYTPAVMDLTVNKVWNDANNQDGKRPYGVVLTLFANGTSTGNSVVVTSENGWSAVWKNMPVYENGHAISYSVAETGYYVTKADLTAGSMVSGIPEGYSVDHSYDHATYTATVTNYYEPETTFVSVRKHWEDANNQDGIRPSAVTVQLLANGNAVGTPVTLEASNHWHATFTNLAKYENGRLIAYTVEEVNVPSGYTVSYQFDSATRAYLVTNTHTPETVAVSVEKVWEDSSNQDGIRPASIMVALYKDGVDTGVTAVLNAANGWQYTFAGLAKNSAGVTAGYTVREVAVPDGYTVDYAKTVAANGDTHCVITNIHIAETTSLTVSKVWEDRNDQDGKRPDSISVTLLANGSAVQTVSLSAGGNWAHTFSGLAVYANGQKIIYTVTETVPDGYTATIDGLVITNSYEPATVDLAANKVWDDNNNQDGKRPFAVVLTLYKNGYSTQLNVTVTADNGWSAQWKAMPMYENGHLISYTVAETGYYATQADLTAGNMTTGVPEGYTVDHSYDHATYTATITNSYDPESTFMNIQKHWEDANDQDGIRPASVEVILYKTVGGVKTKIQSVILNDSNEWDVTVLHLPRFEGGQYVSYSVEEIVPSGYTVSYEYDNELRIVYITNTHKPATLDIPVSKVWDDSGNQDGKRTESVSVRLHANGVATSYVVTLNAGNGWSASYRDVPKFSQGKEIVYSVVEETVPTGYTVAVSGNAASGFVVTNSYNPEVISVTVSKVWNDGNNQDGLRPGSIVVRLLADGVVVATQEMNPENLGIVTFRNLPRYTDGREIVYTVEEDVPAPYTASYSGNVSSGFVITNSYTPKTMEISVSKVWEDNSNQDGKRPYAVVMTLYKEGVATGYTVTLTSGSNWAGKWSGMPMYENGLLISYSVSETGYYVTREDLSGGKMTAGLPTGYSVDYTYASDTNVATVTNSYDPESTFVNIQKHWEDGNNQDGIRPDSVVVILYKTVGGVKTEVQRVELNNANEWDVSILHLPRFENGQYVNYSVEEVPTAGYTAEYRFDNALRIVYITNTHTPAMVNIPVSKVWNDSNNQDGKRPGEVTVRLYANGVATVNTLKLNESNHWSGIFENAPKFAHGVEVIYSVREEAVAAGYVPTVSGDVSGFVITNTYDPEVTSVSVSKVWNDGNNQDNTRPNAITVNLLADGVIVDSVELNPENLGMATFDNLPVFNGGKAIVYTVEEVVPNGYTATYSGNAKDGFIITNFYAPKQTGLTVSKVWDDSNNLDGLRPASVKVHLTGLNGEILDTVELSDANGWTYTWQGLDVYASGTKINYTVREEHVNGYTVNYSRDPSNDSHVIITNSYRIEYTSVTVQKVWYDQNNQDGKRPESVTASLYANGMWVEDVTLNAANNWKYTWSNLRKLSGGVEVNYTVREKNVPRGYKASVRVDQHTGVIQLVNSYETAKTDVVVRKIWNDMDDFDGIRPDSILVQLYRNGARTNRVVELSEENNWTYVFKDLPKYENGQLASYFAMEEYEIPGYTATYSRNVLNEVTITNTHIPKLTSVSVTKIWDDSNNKDGLRPESITVKLFADGEYVASLELNAENLGKGTFENLPLEKNGVRIVYTVEEVVPDGYTAAYSGNAETGFVITNTHTLEQTSMSVEKHWDDRDDQDGKRPDTVTVHLLANGEHTGRMIVLHAGNGWKGQWKDLPKYSHGSEIVYTVVEESSEGYMPIYQRDGNHVIITNKYDPEITELAVLKVWRDNDNQDGLRREVEVELYANGKPTGKKAVLSSQNNWEHVFLNLDKFENGKMIVYTAVELEIPDGYTVSYAQDEMTGIFEIINTYVPQTTSVTVNKIWEDDNDRDGIRPASIVVTLYANGISTGKNVVLEDANNWSHTFADLPVFAEGKKVIYSVEEQAGAGVVGYTSRVLHNEDGSITLINTHVPEMVQITVDKQWLDNDDEHGMRPGQIVVHLLANGEHTGQKVTLSLENNWHYSWSALNKFEMGDVIIYTVMEEPVENYSANYIREGDHLTIVNTYAPGTTDLTVLKVWHDNHDQDGLRQDVEVELFANGQPTGRRAMLSEVNNWKYEFIELPKFSNGEVVVYTAVELTILDGYTVSYKQDELTGIYEVINTHEVEKIQVNVSKVWEDQDNASGLRPERIVVELYANDVPTGIQLTLDEVCGWKGAFSDLDRNAHGEAIVYSVKEVVVPEGYEVLYTALNGVDGNVNITVSNAIISNPGTGDDSHIGAFVLLAVLSMAGFVTLYAFKKKKDVEA